MARETRHINCPTSKRTAVGDCGEAFMVYGVHHSCKLGDDHVGAHWCNCPPNRVSNDAARGSEARPGVGGVVESDTVDEKGLASRVEELEKDNAGLRSRIDERCEVINEIGRMVKPAHGQALKRRIYELVKLAGAHAEEKGK